MASSPPTIHTGAATGSTQANVPLDVVQKLLVDALADPALAIAPERAKRIAEVFAASSLDGVQSHGLNRFPKFVADVRAGVVDTSATLTKVQSLGALEQWDGRSGVGIENALACTDRAIELAKAHGIGCVALRNNNHWMRGGTYGWHAADRGYGLMCWTNTMPNLPAWGSAEPSIGNNPLVIALPRRGGAAEEGDPGGPFVFDAAISQFSMGKLGIHSGSGEPLPVPGGYDSGGRPTTDAKEIIASQRALPIGYWKGSALAIMLDVLGAALGAGNATCDIGRNAAAPGAKTSETDVCQCFIAFDVAGCGDVEALLARVTEQLHGARPATPGGVARHPGEGALARREENLRRGVPVDTRVRAELEALAAVGRAAAASTGASSSL